MRNRTDLAIESIGLNRENLNGTNSTTTTFGDITVTCTVISEDFASKTINKPIGKYITVDIPCLTYATENNQEVCNIISEQIKNLLPENKNGILVIGLGNREITPDALGPKACEKILATRHIADTLAEEIGLIGLKNVSVLSPGVLGQTGIETVEIIKGIINKTMPTAVIVIDALAAKSIKRIGTTIQISNVGISPGSGVGNKRKEISKATLGIPVIAIGIPTVVDAETLCLDISGFQRNDSLLTEMIVTPREIDTIIEHASLLLGHSINTALQPNIDGEILQNLV